MMLDNINFSIDKNETVIVAMSGGVDSSVAALIAKQYANKVIGITLKMFNNDETLYIDAKKIADQLEIDWYLIDYTDRFNKDIIAYFIKEYKFGRTPNPCSRCNRISKTIYLYEEMINHNATKIITGHYAKLDNYDNKMIISTAVDSDKDQSYYLSLIEQEYLNYLRFPLGTFKKREVRNIAKENNLIIVSEKKESQDICFLSGGDYRDFIKPFAEKIKSGNFILNDKIVGANNGIYNYTIGQRRGLDISYSEPLYVKYIDAKSGDVYLDTKDNIDNDRVSLHDCNFFTSAKSIFRAKVKLRYRMKAEDCLVERLPDNCAEILFDNKQFAPAAGQTASIYVDDRLVGGGIIK